MLLCAWPLHAAPLRVIYPVAQQRIDESYYRKLLQLALEKSGIEYAMKAWMPTVVKGRALHELEQGQYVDVVWAVTNRQREAALLPVRIPLDRGLSGWRLLMIRGADVGRFQPLRTLAHLRQLTAGQGFDWVDTQVMRANELPVITGPTAESLAKMLAASRFDYFPRSVSEIWDEAERQADSGVAVEPSLLLRYPQAVYFFVNKDNAALAAALDAGLRKSMADGSFDKLFRELHGEALKRANLPKRRIIDMANPELPPATPLGQKELWQEMERSSPQ